MTVTFIFLDSVYTNEQKSLMLPISPNISMWHYLKNKLSINDSIEYLLLQKSNVLSCMYSLYVKEIMNLIYQLSLFDVHENTRQHDFYSFQHPKYKCMYCLCYFSRPNALWTSVITSRKTQMLQMRIKLKKYRNM